MKADLFSEGRRPVASTQCLVEIVERRIMHNEQAGHVKGTTMHERVERRIVTHLVDVAIERSRWHIDRVEHADAVRKPRPIWRDSHDARIENRRYVKVPAQLAQEVV